MPNIPSHVPLERAPGSPYANAYGATDRNGNPIANKVAKARVSPRRTPVALSPLERAAGKRTPDRTNGDRTLSALRMAFSPPSPTPLRRVAKAKDDVSDMIAVYDANGNLLGVCDPADMQALSTGTPAQPAAQPDSMERSDSMPAVPGSPAVPPTVQPVAKSRKPLTLREKWDAQKILRRVGR